MQPVKDADTTRYEETYRGVKRQRIRSGKSRDREEHMLRVNRQSEAEMERAETEKSLC